MKKFTYSQIASMIGFYLWKYPSLAVALECVREDVEGDGEKFQEIHDLIEEIRGGRPELEAVNAWTVRVGSFELMTMMDKVNKAVKDKEDIGFCLKKNIKESFQKGKPTGRRGRPTRGRAKAY